VAAAVDAGDVDVVAVHDTARPLAEATLFATVIEAAHRHGGALPGKIQRSLLPRRPGTTVETGLVAVQTPQAFRAPELLAAYRQADRDRFTGTDTASCVERYTDLEIHRVESPATNIKITFAGDVPLAERLLGHS
jgi:2-C-methyl-D-erythritol 4-phosphate cytidylyltransferase